MIALLLNIIESFMHIIENKKTDSVWVKQKEEAWKKIASEFNEATYGVARTPQQLKIAYENYKRRTNKLAADDKAELYKSGGGTFKRKLDADGERLISRLNSHFTPANNPCDSDGQYQVFQVTGQDCNILEDSHETLFDGAVSIVHSGRLHSTSGHYVTGDKYGDEASSIPSSPSPANQQDSLSAGRHLSPEITPIRENPVPLTGSRSGIVRPRSRSQRSRLEDYTSSKADFNELRCRLLIEKHEMEMEMEILKTNLQVAQVELEIKRAILAKENK
ncbi:myb/SANT-like DNA-binding domain-containing protein 3 isoform X1 [Periplaneta americana]|uniref:myb/SANT-like DNA-binding domain-containing protein 3 isoform X1 n=1 Tax=Periplaneta americana TaxID=6978 RepID=UPI0037E933E0